MKYAIIAAGEGSRLIYEGVVEPKPLVKIGGEALLGRLIRIFKQNNATEILVICNEQMRLVHQYLLKESSTMVRTIVRSTHSSMHSLYELSKNMTGEPFVLTTVDTVFREDEFADYADTFIKSASDGVDALMGVTEFVDDESPLYVGTDDNMTVNGFYDTVPLGGCKYVSAGIYGLTTRTLETLRKCIERGESRMRNFQRALITDGLCVKAYPFSKAFDIDHTKDILRAEEFVREGGIE